MKIVITGPPCSGKSSIIEPLSKIHPTVEEVARHWIAWFKEHEPYHLPWNDRDFFQPFVETIQLKNLETASKADSTQPIFFDRGLPDEIGYRKFFGLPVPEKLIANCKNYRYDKILYFPYWHEIYKKDEVRIETHDEARLIDEFIREGYADAGYHLIEVPFGTIEERLVFINKELKLEPNGI